MKIEDGTGSGRHLKVNGRNEGQVFSVSQSETESATDLGDSYNLNTGDIGCGGDTTLIYLYNDQDNPLIIEALAVGIRGSTITDQATVTLIRNPTGGDLISDASAVAQNQNRNFGSSKSLKSTTLVYKGKVSGTVSGGNNIAQFYMGNNSRLFATINFSVPRGSALAVKVEDTTSAGNAYCALVVHEKDGSR